jgi:flagellar protein FliS
MIPTANRSARAYASVALDSRADGSGPHEVVMLLFEGLLERIALGRLAIVQRDVNNKIRHLDKALQILGEGLRTHLDTKAGGELALQLDGLYAYCSVQLLHANAHDDTAALDEVHGLIKQVADAWRETRP